MDELEQKDLDMDEVEPSDKSKCGYLGAYPYTARLAQDGTCMRHGPWRSREHETSL
jgi:hypothetical protein